MWGTVSAAAAGASSSTDRRRKRLVLAAATGEPANVEKKCDVEANSTATAPDGSTSEFSGSYFGGISGTVYEDVEPLLPLLQHKGIDEIRFAQPRD